MTLFQNYPTSIAGMALGLGSLGSAWMVCVPSIGITISTILVIIAVMLTLPILFKFGFCKPCILDELKDPLLISVLPTLTMLGMICSNLIALMSLTAASYLWLSMVVLQGLIIVCFIYFHLCKATLQCYVHSWFIPPVGIALACTTLPTPSLWPIATVIFWFAISLFALLFALFCRQVFVHKELQYIKSPTIVIFSAPASICLSGYLTINPTPNDSITIMLLFLSIALLLFGYFCIVRIIRRSTFTPLFACFTFPLAISTIAMMKFSHWATQFYGPSVGNLFRTVALCELVIATVVIMFIAVQFIRNSKSLSR